MTADELGQAADQRRPGAVAAGVDDPGPRMGRLEAEAQAAVGTAIEPGPQREQLVNPVRAFTCEDANGLGIGQPIARREGIGRVLAGAVAGAEGHGDAALGPGAGAVGEGFLGEDNGAPSFRREPPGGPQPGDARADDDGAVGSHGGKYTGRKDGRARRPAPLRPRRAGAESAPPPETPDSAATRRPPDPPPLPTRPPS